MNIAVRAAVGLQRGSAPPAGSRTAAVHGIHVLGSGSLPGGAFAAGSWHTLQLNSSGASFSGSFDGQVLFSEVHSVANTNGAAALASSYSEVVFDNVAVEELPMPAPMTGSMLSEVLTMPYGQSTSALAVPGAAKPAPGDKGFEYGAGLVMDCVQAVSLTGLGRWKTDGGSASHQLSVLDVTNLTAPLNTSGLAAVATATLDLASCVPDALGFCYGKCAAAQLQAGHRYAVLSSESTGFGADSVYAKAAVVDSPGSGVKVAGSAISVNGSLTLDTATAACNDNPAYAGACNSTNPLQTSCSSSDWLAPSVQGPHPGWNFQTDCCASYTAKCSHQQWLGPTVNGPVSALLQAV